MLCNRVQKRCSEVVLRAFFHPQRRNVTQSPATKLEVSQTVRASLNEYIIGERVHKNVWIARDLLHDVEFG